MVAPSAALETGWGQLRTAVAVVREPVGSHWVDSLPGSAEYEVIFTTSVAEAGTLIRRLRPDAIIICLEFSDMSAFQLLSMLSGDINTRDIPLIACEMMPHAGQSTAIPSQLRDMAARSPVVQEMN
jgi:CheY-like chemotaxis protein